MGPRVTLALAVFFCSCVVARGDEFPFDGYVAADQAEVASGPGKRFYVTDRLRRGTKVEVYREDAAGWLAIRPPDGSFCWVPAEQVELLEDGSGKVIVEVPCWIGTNVERVKEHQSQVQLKAGEMVEVLDERTVAGDEKWLKIAPPAGEFRYINAPDVSREPVEMEAREEETGGDREKEPGAGSQEPGAEEEPERFELAGPVIAIQDIEDVRSRMAALRENLAGLAGPRSPATGPRQVELAQFQSAVEAPASRSISPDGFVPRKRRSSEQLPTVPVPSGNLTRKSAPAFTRPKLDPPALVANNRRTLTSTIASAPASPAVSTISSTTGIAGDEVARQLEQVELELSLMLAQDKSTWNLAALRQRVEQLVERGATPADRGQARLVLDKLNQIEQTFDVQDYGPIAASPAAASPSAEVAGTSPADPRYDGTGWLKPVVSRSKPAAPYALVDTDGNPLCFVTPSPGLNLGRYLNKQVGVYGRRGYLQDLKKPHVLAERVIDLERHLR